MVHFATGNKEWSANTWPGWKTGPDPTFLSKGMKYQVLPEDISAWMCWTFGN